MRDGDNMTARAHAFCAHTSAVHEQEPSIVKPAAMYRRMDFSVRCAYAHGTSALRTHLINMTPKQLDLTWPAFQHLRSKWRGKVRTEDWDHNLLA